MTADPQLSVIVPAHNAAAHLRACLDAIAASDLERSRWELIVVDDASTDSTPEIAKQLADCVISTGTAARGPAHARNRGALEAKCEVIAFVDADVAVHSDALRLMLNSLAADKSIVAVFGSYDDEPADHGIISRYRNLLHHFAHNESAGKVGTFWAGCGAVKAEAFLAAGKFDDVRYARPQIEDIDLGYKLSRLGGILLDPSVKGTHFKRWRFLPMLRTDLLDRGIPWVRLLLSTSPAAGAANPSLGRRAVLGTAAACGAVAVALVAVVGGGRTAATVSVALVVASILLSLNFYRFLATRGGAPLLLAGIPLHFIYQIVSGLAVPIGAILYFTHDRS